MNLKQIICLTVFACGAAIAHDHVTSQAMPDAQAIEHRMKQQFDKPDAPLAVAPVSIEGDYAVAGWIQSGKGGRALLKKKRASGLSMCAAAMV